MISTSPANGATGVSQGTTVTATFSEAMNATTVTTATFELRGPGNTVVSASVTYNAPTHTATLTPAATLVASTTYTATVKGGATGMKDLAGNALAADFTWSFTTAAGPNCPCSGWSSSTTPTNPSVSDPNAVELGVKFRSDLDGFITGIRFYKGTGNTGIHVGNLWTTTGTQLATATFTNETTSGWQQVNFATPVAITANTVYVASYFASNGNYAFDGSYFANTGFRNGSLYFLKDGESGGNGVYVYSASTNFPTNTFNAANYWVDVVFTTSTGSDTTPPTVPGSLTATAVNTTQINLTWTASTDNVGVSGYQVERCQGAGCTNFAQVATPTGTNFGDSGLTAGTTYQYRARAADAAGNLSGYSNVATAITQASDTTPPTVTSTSPASGATGVNTGTMVTATFSEAMDPATISTSTFELRDTSNAVAATVSYNASTRTATQTPSSPLAGLTTYTATVKGGASGVKDLAGNALAANVTWSFTTVGGSACPCSIWPATATPVNANENDNVAVELGVKFTSDVSGFITGIRFYKSTANTGTHVGTLWSSIGQQLAQATFTSETASGWQQVNFSSPVAISANTVYVASYHTNVGHYAGDNGYFATSGVDNAPLHALRDGVNGGNGVFVYSANPAFPSSSFQATNYWVDVVFNTTGPPSDTTPPAAPTGLTATASTTGVALAWAANTAGDLAGYHVYRGASADGPFTRLNATLLTTPAYEDTLAPGGTSFYRVTAVDMASNESTPSATASATMATANRLLNPGFELDANNDTRPDNWSTNTRVTRSSEVVRSGGFAMKHLASDNSGYTISQTVSNLTPGTTYTFAGWVNIPATTDTFTFRLQVRWRNGNTTLRTDTVKTYTASTAGWDKATASLTAPTGTTNAQALMVVSSLNAAIYTDDFASR